MKLLVVILTVSISQLSANVFAQQARVSLNLNNVSIQKVFNSIEENTEYSFVYSIQAVEKLGRVTLDVENETVLNILNKCLEDTKLGFEVKGNIIVIKPKTVVANQEKSISIEGVVTDDSGNPLPGVSVVLKGTTMGVTTDINGKFNLEIPEKGMVLVFSFIGMKSQEVKVEKGGLIEVVLKEDKKELDEVVVTGYFQKSKESFTGTAVTVSGEELRQANNQNILSALQAVDPSFVLVENNIAGSNPNALPEFQIRGSSSMPGMKSEYEGNPNMPTFILDGFEVSAEKVFDLDPNRVKSITLLKDASATAIYGSRASNGVVVIETKAPEAGEIQVSYNLDMTIAAPDLSVYNLLNAREKLQLEKDAGYYFHGREDVSMRTREEALAKYNTRLSYIEQGYDTYWLAQPVKTSVSHKHSLLLEGGDHAFRYGLDVGYNDNSGVMKGSGRDRYGIGIKLQYRVENFTFMNKLTYDDVKSINSPYGNFNQYATLNPYYKYKDDNGNYIYQLNDDSVYPVFNPLYNTTLKTVDESKYRDFVNDFSVDWQINNASKVKGSISISQKTTKADNFKPAAHTDFGKYKEENVNRKGKYIASNGESSRIDGSLIYSYYKNIDKHLISINAGMNIKEEKFANYTIVAEGFPNEDLNSLAFAGQYEENSTPSGTEYTSRLIGTLGSFNYTYDNKYLADLSYRVDGSSRFGADSKWAPFWSTGIGWNMHNEPFMSSYEFVNRLKLRASYGITGSQEFDPYQAITTYEYYMDTRYHYGYGATMKALGNDDLKWQKTIQSNLGIDMEMFDRNLVLSFNYYNNLSKDVLTPITLPTSLGFSTYMENLGEIENKGYEISVRTNVLKDKERGINWSVFGALVHNKNTLKKLSNSLKSINDEVDNKYDDPDSDKDFVANLPSVRYVEGQSANTIWVVKSLGIDPNTGKEVFLDRNGNQTYEWSSKDMVVGGTDDADFTGNIGTNFNYKGLQLNVIFQYRYGGEYYNNTLVQKVENADKRFNVDRRVYEDRWKQPGDMTFFKDVADNSITKPTSRFIEEYNYINLSSLNLSYEFGLDKLEKFGFKRFKAMFSMNDVFRSSTVKVERGTSYPFARSFTFSLQTKF